MKKTSKKRVAAFALALAMACTSMPVSMETVWAEEIEGTGETEGTEVCESHIYGENGYCTSCRQKLLVSVTTADENPTTSYYTDFALAIKEAEKDENTGCTVTLLSDISLAETVSISSGNFTLDLDEYILECSKSTVLIILGGTIDIIAKEKGKIKGYNGICIYGGTVKVAASIEATDLYGNAILITNGNLTVSGGTIKGDYGINKYNNSGNIVIEESANIIGNIAGISIANFSYNGVKLEITGGTVSGKECAIFYSFHEADSSSGIIISGGTISCGEGDGHVFYDNLKAGSAPGSLILKGGSYPNGIILGEFCRDLSEMLGENCACLDSDGNVVALTEGEKNYSTIRSIVEDKEPPVVQYQIGEQEAVPLSDDEAKISIVEGEELAFSASDSLIGLDTLSYHISQTKIGDTSTIISESWQEYSEALKLEKSNGCYLYVQAKDKLNNTTVHAIELKFIPKITDIPTISGTYGQSLSEMTLSKTEGVSDDEIAGTWSITHADKENIYPTVGTDATYEVTFTPTDRSYNTVTKSTTVTVSKATPWIVENPAPEEITYGQPLSDSSLKDGKVQCSETNQTLVEGTFTWGDTSRVPSVSDSNVTEFEVVFTPSDTENYDTVITTVTITVNKIENVPNRPQSSMNVSNKYEKLDEVPLPDGWEWKVESMAEEDKVLEVGKTITATAQYTGGDKVDYINIEIAIEVTRSECEHTEGAVVWDETVDTDVAPTCEREGYGHTTCTKCGNVVKSGIHVGGLDHEYKSEITKKATYTEEGIRTYTCTQPGCTATISTIATIRWSF